MEPAPFTMQSIPLQTFSSTIVHEILHAMLSMKALLAVTRKGASGLTAEDVAADFNLTNPSDGLLESTRKNANTAAEAAAIIFIHSACENAIIELIKLLARYDRTPWLENVVKKQVNFEEVASSTPEVIGKRLLDSYISSLERESLPKKIDRLLLVIQRESGADLIADYVFDRAELVKIDNLRHRLTHDPSFEAPIEDAAGKLTYLVKTLRWLVALAEKRYPGAGRTRDTSG
jgi:hypothetical protein